MRLGNRRALVTGAASGIGAAIARAYAREGARVCVADLDGAGAARMAAELGDGALGIRMDVASEEEVERGVAEAAYGLGGIDILVSNAGVQHLDTIADLSFENWRRVLAVHLDGGFLTARACLRRMIAQGSGGAILLMGSPPSRARRLPASRSLPATAGTWSSHDASGVEAVPPVSRFALGTG